MVSEPSLVELEVFFYHCPANNLVLAWHKQADGIHEAVFPNQIQGIWKKNSPTTSQTHHYASQLGFGFFLLVLDTF